MEQNFPHSPEASTDERASPSISSSADMPAEVPADVPADSSDPRFFIESMVSPSLNETNAFRADVNFNYPRAEPGSGRERRARHDGWTPERQTHFLETLSACGVVADACRTVGLSAQSAYAFRNRRAGRAFGTAWDAVLINRARGRMSDELLSRAMNGCIEAVHNQNGSIIGEKHRYDNRLSMAVLTRLDRLAERQGDREEMLRAVSEDLDELCDCIEDGGDADAFVEARRPRPAAEPEPEPEPQPAMPRVEDEWDRMASIIGCLDYKHTDPAEIDISDLGPNLGGSIEQMLRAHYSGYMYWLELNRNDRLRETEARRREAEEQGEGNGEQDDLDELDESPEAYMEKLWEYRRRLGEASPEPDRPEPEQPSTSSTYCAPGVGDGHEGAIEPGAD